MKLIIDTEIIKDLLETEWGYEGIRGDLDNLFLKNGIPLEQIRDEIEKPLRVERYADTESAKAQAIALSWCLEVIDKYR